MRKYTYILALIALLSPHTMHSTPNDANHLTALLQLMDKNLAYDSIIPPDSVIAWAQQISPVLEATHQNELFFRLAGWLTHLYSMNGDIGPAIDEARHMYEKAEAMNYDLGIALSSAAIGDSYYCSNMPQKAIESYKEAIAYPVSSSSSHFYKEMSTLQLISLLMEENKMEEASFYRNKLAKAESIKTNKSLQFFSLATDVTFYILKGDPHKAQKSHTDAVQLYESDPQPYFRTTFYNMQGQYHESADHHAMALHYYDQALKSISNPTRSVKYMQIAHSKARLLINTGNKAEAAHLYEEISMITDSVVAPSYSHRINSLRASYRESRMIIENQTEANRIIMGGILVGFIVLAGITYLASRILKQNRKIAASKLRLQQSRLKAENAIQTKSLFLSNMSHEIRTPLSALSGFSNLLTDQELDADTRRQCSEIIQQNSDLLLKLINDVIDLSNLEMGDMKFNFGYFDAITLCNNVIDTVNKVKQTSAEVRFSTSLQSLQIYTDDSRLQQLLINLLINSTKFTPQGTITLEVEQQSEATALFSVTDTGCGIPLEKQAGIFNRFEKLNENAQGTGLGLSICQLIIERIGGEIWIDSSYTGGCRFCFTHPIQPTTKGKEPEV